VAIALGGGLLAKSLHAQPAFPEPNLPAALVDAFDSLFGGPHEAWRAVHAKGVLYTGEFLPAVTATELSHAVHLAGSRVSVLVRFSNFAAVPGLPDGDAAASPRGLAIKFLLPGGAETDIVAHSYDGFPAATPAAFLNFLRAVPDQAALNMLAGRQPAVRRFLEAPKPAPASYATEAYFGVNSFRFTNVAGVTRFGRYRILPIERLQHLTPEEAAGRASDYLAQEMQERLAQGPAEFRLIVQLAGSGDAVNDGSVAWPADRPMIELGTVRITAQAAGQDAEQRDLRFVPTSLVGGIAPSSDPMLLTRTQAYMRSADRREAP
jgi:catalase